MTTSHTDADAGAGGIGVRQQVTDRVAGTTWQPHGRRVDCNGGGLLVSVEQRDGHGAVREWFDLHARILDKMA